MDSLTVYFWETWGIYCYRDELEEAIRELGHEYNACQAGEFFPDNEILVKRDYQKFDIHASYSMEEIKHD